MIILQNCCTIQLSNGMITLVDQENWLILKQYNWTVSFNGYSYYAKRNVCNNGVWISYIMHRVVAGIKDSNQVDHRDGDTLNNTKSNLRILIQSQNKKNKRRISGESGFKCVIRRGDRWCAYIRVNKIRTHIGIYDTPGAYDNAARRLHGEYACTNADLKCF